MSHNNKKLHTWTILSCESIEHCCHSVWKLWSRTFYFSVLSSMFTDYTLKKMHRSTLKMSTLTMIINVGRTTRPWIERPASTHTIYPISRCNSLPGSFIPTIWAAIRKVIPTGDNLNEIFQLLLCNTTEYKVWTMDEFSGSKMNAFLGQKKKHNNA